VRARQRETAEEETKKALFESRLERNRSDAERAAAAVEITHAQVSSITFDLFILSFLFLSFFGLFLLPGMFNHARFFQSSLALPSL
jgi:hypothetical protein